MCSAREVHTALYFHVYFLNIGHFFVLPYYTYQVHFIWTSQTTFEYRTLLCTSILYISGALYLDFSTEFCDHFFVQRGSTLSTKRVANWCTLTEVQKRSKRKPISSARLVLVCLPTWVGQMPYIIQY